ncbi:MAG: hypothetical protein AB1765_11545 [Candidatus Hydrogenedentota bacterium]
MSAISAIHGINLQNTTSFTVKTGSESLLTNVAGNPSYFSQIIIKSPNIGNKIDITV